MAFKRFLSMVSMGIVPVLVPTWLGMVFLTPAVAAERAIGPNGTLHLWGESVPVPDDIVSVEAQAHWYLGQVGSDLGLDQPAAGVRKVAETHSGGAIHVRFRRTHWGLPVWGSDIIVHLRDGRVTGVDATAGIEGHRPVAQLNRSDAIGIARKKVEPVDWRGTASAALYFHPVHGAAVWVVDLPLREPLGDWEVVVDGQSGTVHSVVNRLRRLDGIGWVFDPNPVVTSGDRMLSDNDDGDSDILTQNRFARTLGNLDGSGFLRGSWCDADNREGRASEPELVFDYTRSDPRFEEVMAYYSIDRWQSYAQDTLGVTGANDQVQLVEVHGHPADGSYFSPLSRMIVLGDGGVDDGEDADIILHEYGHAVLADQVSMDRGFGPEALALGEGFSDYLPASFFDSPAWDVTDAPCVGDWDAVSRGGWGKERCLRRVDGWKRYPSDLTGDPHADGEIWSGALWDLRRRIGRETCDRLVLESHFRLVSDATFLDGALALLATDMDLYGGFYRSAIWGVFRGRGILTLDAIVPPLVCEGWWFTDENGDGLLFPGERGSFRTRVRNATNRPLFGIRFGLEVMEGPAWVEPATEVVDVLAAGDTLDIEIAWVGSDPDIPCGSHSEFEFWIATAEWTAFHSVPLEMGIGVTRGHIGHPASELPRAIPDHDPEGIVSKIGIDSEESVGSIEVHVDIEHSWVGDLRIELIPPDGPTIVLRDRVGGSRDDLVETYTAANSELGRLEGRPLVGPWALRVADLGIQDEGTLRAWSIGAERMIPECPQERICTMGRVNGGKGLIAKVLSVNGVGLAEDAKLSVWPMEPLWIRVEAPPAGPEMAPLALYVARDNGEGSEFLPADIGDICFALPGDEGEVGILANRLGWVDLLGEPPPGSEGTAPGEWEMPRGFMEPGRWIIQGLVRDDASGSPFGVSVTNAVVIDVQAPEQDVQIGFGRD